jgi:hypothetical protein
MSHIGLCAPARQGVRPDFPPHDIPEGPVPDRFSAALGFPPLGGWLWFQPRPSVAGWHISCPSCLEGRVLLRRHRIDCIDYEMQPDTCSNDCDPYSVVRWLSVRLGDPELWWDWLDRQRARRAAR